MNKQVLFLQGGGDDGYTADQAMVASLKAALGKEYSVHYPELPSDESKPDYGWIGQIATHISKADDDVIIVAHSFGASMLLKYLSENKVQKKIAGIFLISTPFWDGDVDWQKPFELKANFAAKLPKDIPITFYHSRDDEEIPVAQFEQYKEKVIQAAFHEIKAGGHQFNNDLARVAKDVKSLR